MIQALWSVHLRSLGQSVCKQGYGRDLPEPLSREVSFHVSLLQPLKENAILLSLLLPFLYIHCLVVVKMPQCDPGDDVCRVSDPECGLWSIDMFLLIIVRAHMFPNRDSSD